MAVFMQPIYTQTVGAGGAATVTFNNIPQGFDDLLILCSARDGRTDAPYANSILRINGNDNRVYNSANLFGVTSTIGSGNNLNEPWFFYSLYTNGQVSTANTFSNASIRIVNYTGATFKNLIFDSVVENNSMGTNSNILVANASLFQSRNPVTSLQFTAVNGVFQQYTTFTVYGISNVFDTTTPAAPTIGSVTDLAGFASVAFTANDSGTGRTADSYVVTSTPSGSTTYGVSSPIVTPAVVDTSYTYQVAALNSLGSNSSAASSALTSYGSWASIATFAITSSTASVTFSNIPQNYKHLVLHITGMAASTSAAQVDMGLNGDGSTLYTFHQFYGSNTTASSGSSAPRNDIPEVGIIRPNNQTKPGVSELFLYDYTDNSKFKVCHWYLGSESLTTGYVQQATGMYRSFSPVTTIALTGRGQSFGANSHVALYGIA
jgi:hypothetical protein